MPQRPHVVQPVRQLDNHDAPVLGHRYEHGAQVLRLLVGVRDERLHRLRLRRLDAASHAAAAAAAAEQCAGRSVALGLVRGADHLRQLGDLCLALDNLAHRRAEERLDGRKVELRVLDRVVQQPGDERLLVHRGAREDRRHLDRVGDVGLAAAALLAVVRQEGGLQREPQLLLRRRAQVRREAAEVPVQLAEQLQRGRCARQPVELRGEAGSDRADLVRPLEVARAVGVWRRPLGTGRSVALPERGGAADAAAAHLAARQTAERRLAAADDDAASSPPARQ
mmetsp:Transcript_47513/g.153570  ORF Transcript_47513/g.153570 Transcript_47513/m.153570 type:complete len:281 (+) Transcript_47513:391-1233(+)